MRSERIAPVGHNTKPNKMQRLACCWFSIINLVSLITHGMDRYLQWNEASVQIQTPPF